MEGTALPARESGPDRLRFGAFVLDGAARELRRDGTPVVVPRRVYDCIEYLAANRQRAVGRDELVEHVWGRANVSDVQLGQIIVQARRLLGDDGRVQAYVRTVPGYGYRWVADMKLVDAEAAAAERIEPRPSDALPAELPPSLKPLAAGIVVPPFDDAPPTARKPHWTSTVTAAVAVLLALAVLVGQRYLPPPRELPAGANPVLVLPIEIRDDVAADQRWMRLGLMDLIAERLRGQGVAVMPNESALALSRALPANAADADVSALQRRASLGLVVRAQASAGEEGWHLRATGFDATGRPLRVEANDRDAVRAAQRLADGLLDELGRTHGADDTPDSLARQVLQRAQAAILGNDLDAARDILSSSPALDALEPQRRYRLAEIDFRAGRLAEADAALTALLDEVDATLKPAVLNLRGAVRVRNEQYALARVDFQAVIDGTQADAVNLGKALMGRGITILFSESPDRTAGVADLGRARTLFENAGDRLAVARVDANLGAAEVLRNRHANALTHFASAAERFEELGAVNESITNLSNMVDCQRKLLRWRDALATSERTRLLLPRVVDPKWRLDLAQRHIEALLGVGRLKEALALLPELDRPVAAEHAFLASRGRELRAELAWEMGDVPAALAYAREAIAHRPAHDFWHDEELAVGIYVRALIESGAQEDDGVVGELARRVRTPGAGDVEPRLRIAYAEWAYARGKRDEALEQLRIAQAQAETRGVPMDIVAVAAVLGPMLLSEGRVDESSAVIGRVAVWADHDYTSAVLQARLMRQQAQPDHGERALERARELAGERRLPPDIAARTLTRAD